MSCSYTYKTGSKRHPKTVTYTSVDGYFIPSGKVRLSGIKYI